MCFICACMDVTSYPAGIVLAWTDTNSTVATAVYCAGANLHPLVCIMQVMIYIHLLTITCLHTKAMVVMKTLVKSICLGVQLGQRNYNKASSIIMLITQAADFTWHNKLWVT